MRKKEAAPNVQELALYCWRGHSFLRFNISNFTKQQHLTRPVCDQDVSGQKQTHSILMSGQNTNLVGITETFPGPG